MLSVILNELWNIMLWLLKNLLHWISLWISQPQFSTPLKYCNHTMTPCWLLCQKPHIFCLNTLPGSIVIPTFFHHKLKHAKMRYDSEWREITSIFHSAIMIYFQFHLSKLQQHVWTMYSLHIPFECEKTCLVSV